MGGGREGGGELVLKQGGRASNFARWTEVWGQMVVVIAQHFECIKAISLHT